MDGNVVAWQSSAETALALFLNPTRSSAPFFVEFVCPETRTGAVILTLKKNEEILSLDKHAHTYIETNIPTHCALGAHT